MEWSNRSDNLKHALENGLMESQCKIRRKVTIEKDNKIIKFNSIVELAMYFNIKRGKIYNEIKKYGNIFNYDGYKISIFGRESELK